ncbi:MAG: PAS domain S-box protein, partial [Longimicrobiales bacterium]
GVTIAAFGTTYVAAAALGQSMPRLLLGVGAALIGISLGIGWLAEGGSRKSRSSESGEDVIDALTGLPTRAQAELFLEKEFSAARLGRPLVVLLFDFDHFREFNLRYGSAAGNGVLKAFATLLRQNTRRMNLSARWGPEEFIAILCGSSQEGGLIFAERVLELLRAASEMTTVPTVSVGVACYRANMTAPEALVEAAEDAMLRAKDDGRDRIRVFGTFIEPETEDRPRPTPIPSELSGSPAEMQPTEATLSPEDVGAGRSAFVYTADGTARTHLVRHLANHGFRVIEGVWPADGGMPLKEDYDLMLADVGGAGPTWTDLLQEIRHRAPATRIVGIPRVDGDLISAAVLTVRLDGYCIVRGEQPVFHPPIPELLLERDRQLGAGVRERQLSGEVRAKEREGRVALEESEARYRSVVQRIKEVIFETDREGRLTFINPAFSVITGNVTEQSLGKELFSYINPDDQAEARRDHADLLAGVRPYIRREIRLNTAGGGIRWVEVRAQAGRNAASEIVGISGLMSDVHERKQAAEALRRSEEYFRSLIENSADVMAVLDRDGRIRYTSPAIERVLGFRPEERVGQDAFELVHADDAAEARARFAEVVDTPSATEFLEIRVLHKDGSWRWLEVFVRNLIHVPSVEGLVLNGRDVTDRKAAERALRENEEVLYRSQKIDAIGRLAGGVAHDFNNLLTAIQSSADLLLISLPPESPLRVEAVTIRDVAGRATSLTRQLLAFSRKQVLQPRLVDLDSVLSPMHRMLQRLMGDGIRVHVELAAELPRAEVDPQQIEQVILNFAVNARDAMPNGGLLSIAVTSATLPAAEPGYGEDVPAGEYVVLSVSDTGNGIAAECLGQVFDPFFTTKPGTPGPGLGLSTAYGIVKQSGGYVRVESRTAAEDIVAGEAGGTGTRFTIYLPVAAQRSASQPVGEPIAKPAGGSETIALVEDEKAVRELAQRILRNRGYSVIVAENGRHAIDVIGRFPDRIDLLVTDVVMPEMNGRDLADRIAVMRPGVRVLFMSGYTEDAIVHHGVLADGTAFLAKPFSPDGLVSAVRDALDSPSRARKPLQSPRPHGPPASRQSGS